MSVEIVMPQLGLTMTEGTISTWQKKPGEAVKKDEIVLAVATDKVDIDVESPADGTLGQLLIEVGTTVPVGTVLTHVLVDPTEIDMAVTRPAPSKTVIPSTSSEALKTPASPAEENIFGNLGGGEISYRQERRTIASPRAKKIAATHGINLADVRGSGPRGRIQAADVEAAIPQIHTVREPQDGNTRRRQLIAERMVESITTIPSFSVSVEVDAKHLVTLYDNLKIHMEKAVGIRLTYTDLLLKALSIGLVETPAINTLWDNNALRSLSSITLGMAVATDRGVVAPVIGGIDKLSLDQIVKTRLWMTQKAREGKLTLTDIEGASGTLSNLGMYHIDRFAGIITPGQTFILAVGQLKERPWVSENMLVVRSTLMLNVSVDHRVVDGVIAAQFVEKVAEAIENPYQLLWNVDSANTEKI